MPGLRLRNGSLAGSAMFGPGASTTRIRPAIGTEVRPEMHGALQHQHGMIGWLRPQVAKHRLVRRLLLAARHRDANATQLEQGHRPQFETGASVERARAGEPAVAERQPP